MANFGERLRLLRGRRSQKRVAEELNIPPTTLSTLENQGSLPRGEMLEKLADYFGIPVSYFFPSEPTKPSQAARGYLMSIRQATPSSRAVPTHSTLDLGEERQQKVLDVIRKKSAETQNEQ